MTFGSSDSQSHRPLSEPFVTESNPVTDLNPVTDSNPATDLNSKTESEQSSTVADVVAALDKAYPPEFAEDWDRVGLVCGHMSAQVRRVAFAVDVTDAVVEAALNAKADMLVSHHPLLLRGVSSVAADSPKGRIIDRLITEKCALFSAHTNADRARPGVNDALAHVLGLSAGRPIVPLSPVPLDRWGFTAPVEDVEKVKAAVFACGAGEHESYSECSFDVTGQGQFRALDTANPYIGSQGMLTQLPEVRVEFIAPSAIRRKVYRGLVSAHPYEVPAFDIVESRSEGLDLSTAPGLGRVGELAQPMTLKQFTKQVYDRLPKTVWGVRAAGDPERLIHTVAVCGGSGDSLLGEVSHLGVDCYVTSDLRHHPADEHIRAGGPALIDTAHWASESVFCTQAAGIVGALGIETRQLECRTDPWTLGTDEGTL